MVQLSTAVLSDNHIGIIIAKDTILPKKLFAIASYISVYEAGSEDGFKNAVKSMGSQISELAGEKPFEVINDIDLLIL